MASVRVLRSAQEKQKPGTVKRKVYEKRETVFTGGGGGGGK